MERLTTREEHPHGAEGRRLDRLTGRYCRGRFEATAIVEKLAEYENAEEDGYLLRLPFRVGDKVYSIWRPSPLSPEYCRPCIREFTIRSLSAIVEVMETGALGKVVFRTREEAEAAMREELQKGKEKES